MPATLTAAPYTAPSPELVAALEHGLLLQKLLQQEFDALREQNLDIFEALQPEKTQIFESLIRLTGARSRGGRGYDEV